MICSPVYQVDNMACDGLEFLQNKWPVAKDQTNKVREELKKYPAALNCIPSVLTSCWPWKISITRFSSDLKKNGSPGCSLYLTISSYKDQNMDSLLPPKETQRWWKKERSIVLSALSKVSVAPIYGKLLFSNFLSKA